MLIDSHAHLNFKVFEKDLAKVIKRSLDNDVWLINVGSNYQTSKRAVEISQKYEKKVFAAIGLHPLNIIQKSKSKSQNERLKSKNLEEILEVNFDYEKYKELGKSGKVVAIGEIGLDYYYKPKTKKKLAEFKEKQKELFLKQLDLAKELNLPVIFHCRQGHQDLLEILQRPALCKLSGVVHCFTGNWQRAQQFLEMGFYLGFNGIIFKKIEGIDFIEIIRKTPLERILIETDCPYLTPPQIEEKRNEPLFLKYIAQKIAEIKNESFEKIAEITTKNAKNLFKI